MLGKGLQNGAISSNCITCTVSNCINCNDNASQCLTCSAPKCLNTATKLCVSAQSPCTSCNVNDVNNCSACINGYVSDIVSYINGNPMYNCVPCAIGCMLCSNNPYNCTAC